MSFQTYTTGLNIAFGLTFDKNNNLYIANAGDNNVIKVDTFGNKTIFASGFSYTENVIFDNIGFPIGYLYVMDSTSNIYKLDVNGNKTTFVTNLLGHYLGITFDSNNNLYYTNDANKIYKIDTSGNTTLFINGNGVLNYPQWIAFDSIGNLLIVSLYNHNISKYDSNGTLISSNFISIPNNYFYSLILDNYNNIYASYGSSNNTYGGGTLNKYDSNGNFISTIYNDPTDSIIGLAFDTIGNLYFTDNNLNIITKYTMSTPPLVCFNENTKILTDKGYKSIQYLRKGDLVKTLCHNYIPINMIGKKIIHHPALKERIKDQLYKCTSNEYPEIFEPLIITGCHSILVDDFISNEQKDNVMEIYKDIYVTDDKYRLPVCVDNRATVYEISGNYTIYHLALDNDNYYMNYGIYANGLLVETCSKRYLKELSDMTLIE